MQSIFCMCIQKPNENFFKLHHMSSKFIFNVMTARKSVRTCDRHTADNYSTTMYIMNL